MKFDVDDKNRCRLVCKISFKSVQVCGGCCKMFRGLTFLGTQCIHINVYLLSDFASMQCGVNDTILRVCQVSRG